MLVFGTRPETIKLAPVWAELKRRGDRFRTIVTVTGQHREMLDPFLQVFGIEPDHDLNVMEAGQGLGAVTAKCLIGLEPVLAHERPDVVLVQGDTATVFSAALASYYAQIPVGHVEAGLRTGNKYDPFPEEIYRRLTSQIAELNFAPTRGARDNLLADGVDAATIYVTGNTVVDALLSVADSQATLAGTEFAWLDESDTRLILVTAHRRENLGPRHERVYAALRGITDRHPDVTALYPMHLNPAVREVARGMLGDAERVILCEPPDYLPFVALMKRSYLIITDSGGIQEEAPSLGKPVLVVRETTERPEGVHAGVVRLVGTSTEKVVAAAEELLTNPQAYAGMASGRNPYGDGRAAPRICDALEHCFGLRPDRPPDFAG